MLVSSGVIFFPVAGMGLGFGFFSEHRVDNIERFLPLFAGWGETTTNPNLGSDELVFHIS